MNNKNLDVKNNLIKTNSKSVDDNDLYMKYSKIAIGSQNLKYIRINYQIMEKIVTEDISSFYKMYEYNLY